MPLVSVTRLRLRSPRFLPGFVWHAWTSLRQARRSAGFLAGQVGTEGLLGFWTLTAWTDADAMRRYQGGAAHGRAMPRLQHWCDEAAVAHWHQPGPDLPDAATALRRMAAEGRLSRVCHPSPGHAAGRTAPAGGALRLGRRFGPAEG